VIRLIFATLLGQGLGMERKRHEKSGGARTMALMCLSACLVSILSLELQKENTLDILRLMQGAIQGISFIGMGVIMKENGKVEGLTTSSMMFITFIIGFLLGFNMWFYAIVTAVIVYILGELKYWGHKGEHNA